MTGVVVDKPVISQEKLALALDIQKKFDDQCATARAEACKHIREAKKIRIISNVCSFVTILINVILASAIFAALKKWVPEDSYLMIGGIMALIPAAWGIVKESYKINERLSEHSAVASKYKSFVNECGLAVMRFEEQRDVNLFMKELEQKTQQFNNITNECKHIMPALMSDGSCRINTAAVNTHNAA
jgi:hypothetical protein